MATKDNIIDWAKRQLPDREVYNDEYDRKIRSLMRDLGISFDIIDSAISNTLGLSNNLPLPLGTASSGTDIEASRSDHVHDHGNQLGGSLHSTATTLSAGFLSTLDKTKLDGIEVGATNTALSNATPNSLGTASSGISTSVSRSDHVHDHGNLTGGSLHSVATGLSPGFLAATDKLKLDSVENGATNTPYSASLPQNLGTANAGSTNSVSRADHVHEHGNLVGGSLHALATAISNGFISASDKNKLDTVQSNATNTPLGVATPSSLGIATAGGSSNASREDHIHAHGNQLGGLHSGSLHETATSLVAGFMSETDKSKLDSLPTPSNIVTSVNTSAPLLGGSSGPTVNLSADFETNAANLATLGTASVGVLNKFVRADHAHPSPTDTAGKVFATPIAATGQATLRNLVSTDIPNLDASKITSGTFTSSVLPVETNSATFLSDSATASVGTSGKISDAAHVHPFPSAGANLVFASPDGMSGQASFRNLINNDIPNLDAAKITSGTIDPSRLPISTNPSHFVADASSSATGSSGFIADAGHIHPFPNTNANYVFAGPDGVAGQALFRLLTSNDLGISGVTAASYPTSGNIPTFTVNASGLLTSAGSTNDGTNLANINAVKLQTFPINNATPEKGATFVYTGTEWHPSHSPYSCYYFRSTNSNILGYKQLTVSPNINSEQTVSVPVDSLISPVLLFSAVTNDLDPVRFQIEKGIWSFNFYGTVSGGSTCTFLVEVYKRTTLAAETLLFSSESLPIPVGPSLVSWVFAQPSVYNLNIDDRLVVKVYAKNTSLTSRTVTFFYEGTARYSSFRVPFTLSTDSSREVTLDTAQTIASQKTFSVSPVFNANPSGTFIIQKANGGFGQDVSTGLTNNNVAVVSGGSITIGALPAASIPSTTVTPGTYPSTGQIATFTVGADGRLTAAGSTTSGANLTSINASNITTGSLAETRGGFGTDISGVGTAYLVRTAPNTYVTRTLTAGTGISITNGTGVAGNTTISTTGTAPDAPNIQQFTTPGAFIWNKPVGNYTRVRVRCVGGGGGGAAGRRGTTASGGGGGGSGGYSSITIPYSSASASYSGTVGTGGTGSAAVTTDNTNGGPGGAGTATTITSLIRAGGGGGAGAANTVTSAGGTAGTGLFFGVSGATGSNSSPGITPVTSSFSPGGGASGGSAGAAGGTGGSIGAFTALGGTAGAGGSGVGIPGTSGGSGNNTPNTNSGTGGGGGGGGFSSLAGSAAGSGGNGGYPGGGGGGGGASINGNNSGAGGNGANGFVEFVCE